MLLGERFPSRVAVASPRPHPTLGELSDRGERAANGAAHRAVITFTADHPVRCDARVVRRTARCGNVDDAENRSRGRQRTYSQ
jgi:hypothetical protein